MERNVAAFEMFGGAVQSLFLLPNRKNKLTARIGGIKFPVQSRPGNVLQGVKLSGFLNRRSQISSQQWFGHIQPGAQYGIPQL